MMSKKGLTLNKSQFPKMLANVLYVGRIFVPEFKGEDAQVVLGLHEPIVPEDLFNKVKNLLTLAAGVVANLPAVHRKEGVVTIPTTLVMDAQKEFGGPSSRSIAELL